MVSYTSGINGQLTNVNSLDSDKELQIIRLITRLLFIWFLKEKHLIPVDLFEYDSAEEYLNRFDLETSDYYQAVLQNLFFATLNTPDR